MEHWSAGSVKRCDTSVGEEGADRVFTFCGFSFCPLLFEDL